MPVTRHLPVTWYETQNIHHVTVRDFEALANDLGIAISNRWFFTNEREIGEAGANWRAEYALFEVEPVDLLVYFAVSVTLVSVLFSTVA